MKVGKLTVDRLTTGIIWDDEIKGFGVRSRGHGKFYILKYRIGGRQKWLTIGRHGSPWTPATARTEALRLLGSIAGGQDPSLTHGHGNAITVAELSTQFLDYVKGRRKSTTYQTYFYVFKSIIPVLGKYKAISITSSDIVRLHDGMSKTKTQANMAIRILTSMYNWAGKRGLVPKDFNPCKGAIEKYPENKKERYLTSDEFHKLGKALDDLKGKFPFTVYAIRLLMLTGARKNEILSLKWSYVDIPNGLLKLPDSKTGPKDIYLNESAIKLLAEIPRMLNNPYVIPGSKNGEHLKHIDTVWQKIKDATGIHDITPHSLRHSFASVAVSNGMSLPMIGKLLGHKKPATTQRYAHLAHSTMLEASDAVGNAISAVMGK